MKITTYRSLLTNRKTMLVASIGKCGHDGYREIQIRWSGVTKAFIFEITDGYKIIHAGMSDRGLKSVLNVAHGHAVTSLKAA